MKVELSLIFAKIEDGARKVKNWSARRVVNIMKGLIPCMLTDKPNICQHTWYNIIAGLVNNKSIAPMVFNGSCNTDVFNNWVEHFLIKELKAGQVVIMDNAAFHRSQKTKELIE